MNGSGIGTAGLTGVSRVSPRHDLKADIVLRGPRQTSHPASIRNLSTHGCCVALVYRVRLDERLWIKLAGLEAIEAFVCWEDEFVAGVQFVRPLHPAVMDMLAARLAGPAAPR